MDYAHLEGGHSSVSLQRAIEALRACNIDTGPRAADCAGAAHQWTGAARAPRRRNGTLAGVRHGRALGGGSLRAPPLALPLRLRFSSPPITFIVPPSGCHGQRTRRAVAGKGQLPQP